MPNILAFWDGHKTRILGVSGLLITVAWIANWLTWEQYFALAGLIGFNIPITLHRAITRETGKIAEHVEHIEAKVEAVAPTVAQATARVVQAQATSVAPTPPRRS